MVECLGDVDHLDEFGRTIRIIRRIYAKSMFLSEYMIALFNIKVFLTSKDKMMYRWCCYYPYIDPPRLMS
jgi:hypothetical protein